MPDRSTETSDSDTEYTDTETDLTFEDLIKIGYTKEELELIHLTRSKKKELYLTKKSQQNPTVNGNQSSEISNISPATEANQIENNTAVTNMTEKYFHITLPPFTSNKPSLWLKSVKGRLKAHNVEDKDLFRRVRMDMPSEIIERMPEVMEPSDQNDNFTWFADKIIEEFGKSKEQDIRELLNKCTLSEENGPKRLMNRMIEKAGDALKPFIIADLFKQKIPKELA